MYKSARDSEPDDKDEVSQEVKKLAREICDNTDAMNDLSTSTMKHVKEIKSDMKIMSVGIKSDLNVLREHSTKTDSNVDKLEVSTKKTQQDIHNFSADTIKHG